jgi:NADH-quinone oxidoreductase subunit K
MTLISFSLYEATLLPLCIFIFGVLGLFIARKNIIIVFLSIELMLLGIDVNFILFSIHLDDILGQIFALLILTVAAAESAIGLAILVSFYRLRTIIDLNYINLLKG